MSDVPDCDFTIFFPKDLEAPAIDGAEPADSDFLCYPGKFMSAVAHWVNQHADWNRDKLTWSMQVVWKIECRPLLRQVFITI